MSKLEKLSNGVAIFLEHVPPAEVPKKLSNFKPGTCRQTNELLNVMKTSGSNPKQLANLLKDRRPAIPVSSKELAQLIIKAQSS